MGRISAATAGSSLRTLCAIALMLAALIKITAAQTRREIKPLSRDEVQAIIDSCPGGWQCPPRTRVGGSFVPMVWATIAGPRQQIAAAAREAKREYKKVTPDDFSEMINRPVFSVLASAYRPDKVNDATHDVEHVFLRAKGAAHDDVVRPIAEEPIELELRNGFGAKVTVRDLLAYFDASQVPSGEFEILVLAQGFKELQINVKPKDMQSVR